MVARVTADSDLHALREEYKGRGWMIGRRDPRMFYAWYAPVPSGGNGLMTLHDATVAGLRARVELFERVFTETNSRERAEQAANDLQT